MTRRSRRRGLKPVDFFGIVFAFIESGVAIFVLAIVAAGFSILETSKNEEERLGMTIVAFFSAIFGLAFTSMSLSVAWSPRRLPLWTRVPIVTSPAMVTVFGFCSAAPPS